MPQNDSRTIPDDAALIIVDVQDGLDDPYYGTQRNNPDAEMNMARLLAAWRETRRPLFHIRHNSRRERSPLHPGKPGNAIKAIVAPREGEPLLEKDVNSAFIGTGLEQRLREAGVGTVVIVGLTTNHCVETTARMASNLDFTTIVVSDATAAFEAIGLDGTVFPAEQVHAMSLANLHPEFATVLDTETVLARMQVNATEAATA